MVKAKQIIKGGWAIVFWGLILLSIKVTLPHNQGHVYIPPTQMQAVVIGNHTPSYGELYRVDKAGKFHLVMDTNGDFVEQEDDDDE